ncbi:unnamed protein product [Adineta steineri]|uniref:NHL repeat containing protein n=1 Tax=Adineta steineri TaxID=433720 RepID=A0A813NFC0_9BILA|nr:unnamed protein product [Adineta steineri]CAF0723021.1 unnamed protein product [Adineta steineri]CAF0737339.1 unnamed protein product [Adineta steineri]CAF4004615.1 unnamed protein product [Adineta steineri]CAF4052745.1 unnamed protein product [Adineta steineri]
MNINNTVGPDESTVVNSNTTQLRKLYEHFQKRKLIWIIVFIIFIVIIVTVATSTVLSNKTKREKVVTIEITTATTTTTITTTATTTRKRITPSIIINNNTKWKQNGSTVAGGNGQGNKLNQLRQPEGFYVDDDDHSIYIADQYNHRVVRWEFDANEGVVVAGGNERGDKKDQLSSPVDVILDKEKKYIIICDQGNRRVVEWSLQDKHDQEILIGSIACYGLALDDNGDLYISDRERHQVIRFQDEDAKGRVVAGGNREGNHLNQLDFPGYIFVDENHSVYVADQANNRVMKWMKNAIEGILIAPGQVPEENENPLSQPLGVIVDHIGNVYLSNYNTHQITRWLPGAIEGTHIVGENEYGSLSAPFQCSSDISFDRQGNLYVVDRDNHRIQKFDIDLD